MKKELNSQNLWLFVVAFSYSRGISIAAKKHPISRYSLAEERELNHYDDIYFGALSANDTATPISKERSVLGANSKNQQKKNSTFGWKWLLKSLDAVPARVWFSTFISAIIFLVAVVIFILYSKKPVETSLYEAPIPVLSRTSLPSSTEAVAGTQATNASTTAQTESTSTTPLEVELKPYNQTQNKNNTINIPIDEVYSTPIVVEVNKSRRLPEEYIPTDLVFVNLPGGGKLKKEATKLIEELFKDAQAKGITPKIASSYRSYTDQKKLYDSYLEEEMRSKNLTIGQAEDIVNTYSAKPGHSEHQLGTTVDLICSTCNTFEENENNKKLWKYLEENASRFGFKISYPQNNTSGYKYEPWHLRYWGL